MSQFQIIQIPRAPTLEIFPLKRREIDQALVTLAIVRPISRLLHIRKDSPKSLLSLPGEIRNIIYTYCFGIGTDRVPCPPGPGNTVTRDDKFNLLQTCHQIYNEASSLLERAAVAYIPITGRANLGVQIHRINRSETHSLSRTDLTTIQALANFWRAHFHLHTSITLNEQSIMTDGINFDREVCNLFSRLRQALLIYTSASAKLIQNQNHIKRHAIVHFDHYFVFWKERVALHRRMFTLWHLITIMGRDTNTNWEIRYYEYIQSELNDITGKESRRRMADYDELLRLCTPYRHISVMMEIYGAGILERETRFRHTRTITPSSTHWPSWPEDVPWRKQDYQEHFFS